MPWPTTAGDGGSETSKCAGFDQAGDWWIEVGLPDYPMGCGGRKMQGHEIPMGGIGGPLSWISGGAWERFWERLKYSYDFEPDIYN